MIETPADRNDYQKNRMHKDTFPKAIPCGGDSHVP